MNELRKRKWFDRLLDRFNGAFILLIVFLAPSFGRSQWTNPGGVGPRKANAVMGQSGFNTSVSGVSASNFAAPGGIAIDPTTGKVFVSDSINNRVLRFSSVAAMSIGAAAEGVIGQGNFETNNPATTSFSLEDPNGVHVDRFGSLWIADSGNHRILRFDNASSLGNGPSADGVLGQSNFTSGSVGTGQDSLALPLAAITDFGGNLWVADTLNNRVLRFIDARNKANGSPADIVLGQQDFTSGNPGASASMMNRPVALAQRTVRIVIQNPPSIILATELWVAESGNNRVIRFAQADYKGNGDSANGLLGQDIFSASTGGTSQSKFRVPSGLVLEGGNLWVSDYLNHRVLRFEDAANVPTGGPASFVLGQSDFVSGQPSISRSRMDEPSGLAFDSVGNLFVSENNNRRVLRFSPGNPQPDHTLGTKRKRQKGNNIYNGSGARQKVVSRSRGSRKSKIYFFLQNDGPFDDRFNTRASRGNSKFKIKWFTTDGKRKNVTGRITRAAGYNSLVNYRSKTGIEAHIKPKARGRKTISLRSRSLAGGAPDRVKAKLIHKP